jgi:hypothetical protein
MFQEYGADRAQVTQNVAIDKESLASAPFLALAIMVTCGRPRVSQDSNQTLNAGKIIITRLFKRPKSIGQFMHRYIRLSKFENEGS